MGRPSMRLAGVVLDSPDPAALAAFYARLLGWAYRSAEPGWVTLAAPEGGAGLSFQAEERYVAPVWPAGPDDHPMMVHLDVRVDDLDEASAWATACGAPAAAYQPQDDVRVHLDPYGHPFCLYTADSAGTFTVPGVGGGSPRPAAS